MILNTPLTLPVDRQLAFHSTKTELRIVPLLEIFCFRKPDDNIWNKFFYKTAYVLLASDV